MTAREALRLGTRGGAAVLGARRHRLARAGQARRLRRLADRRARARRRRRSGRRPRPLRAAPRRPAVRRRRGRRPRRPARAGRRGRDRAGASARRRRRFSAMSVSLSTHVLDTERGRPGSGVRVELLPRRRARGERARPTPTGAIAELAAELEPGRLPARLPPALAVLPARRARGRARGRPPPRPAARLLLSGARATAAAERRRARGALRGTHATRRAARRARGSARIAPTTRSPSWSEAEKLEALNAHPAIGARASLSERSAAEQGADADPVILTELAYLNQVYEEKFGFRFVVFVNRPAEERDPRRPARAARAHPRGGAGDGPAASSSRSPATAGERS